jgi:hypothetical protein
MYSVIKTHQTLNALGLAVGLGLLVLFTKFLGFDGDVGAMVAGYLLFGLNYLVLARIYQTLIAVSQGRAIGSRGRVFLFVATFLKFALLIGALYVFLAKMKLSGFYLAAGSLVSLLVLTVLLMIAYLRAFSTSKEL